MRRKDINDIKDARNSFSHKPDPTQTIDLQYCLSVVGSCLSLLGKLKIDSGDLAGLDSMLREQINAGTLASSASIKRNN